MEAIVELIAALVAGLTEALIGLIGAFAASLAALLEFVFIVLTQGRSAASRKYESRKQQRADRLAAAKTLKDLRPQDDKPSIGLKQSAILVSVMIFAVICGAATAVVSERIRKQRVAETRSQVKALADRIAQQINENAATSPTPGKLPERDAWKQPIELSVDSALLGSLVVVRSSGPDRRSGSIDDILAIRVIRASAKEIGGELTNRGIQAIRNAVTDLLPGGGHELPADVDVAEQQASDQFRQRRQPSLGPFEADRPKHDERQ